ncbi:hypothetical protein BsWGS_01656 [Bradybaena similaris]
MDSDQGIQIEITGTESGEKNEQSEYNIESVAVESSGAGLDEAANDEERGSGEFENFLAVQSAPQNVKVDLRAVSAINLPEIEEKFDPDTYPPSYKSNEGKELKVIEYCKTFLKQYNHLCDHRRPIFLKPFNEFDVKKLVCTTIVPTQLPYKDLLDWPGIAEFVAGYLNYVKLRPPCKLPRTLHAPQTTLKLLRGHAFEYSTVLCSMLIGAGYDAFVVSGYATKQVCDLNLEYTKCPFVEDDQVVYTRPITLPVCRYTVRPPRQYKSEYELRMLKKKQEAFKREEDEIKEAQDKQRELDEAPPPDPYYGRRIHSWVMVLKGLRDVEETFFIEPTTGVPHPTDWDQYLGVETLWNNKNYYINMQQYEIQGVGDLKFDIGNSCDWEYIFSGQDLHVQLSPEEVAERKLQLNLMGDFCTEELHLDLPMSWSLPLYISRDDYARLYPSGKRQRRYKYTIVDDYCRYLNPDGLVRKVRRFSDLACEELSYTKEFYKDRADMMETRFLHVSTGKVIDNFAVGRKDFIREHQYVAYATGPEKWRVILYEPNKRVDGQIKREEDSFFIKHYFEGRDDKKYYKEIQFGQRGKVLENPHLVIPNARPIEVIIERFHRNPDVPANSDIAKITYTVWVDEIDIEYHVEDHRIVCSTRHFTKPPQWWDETQILAWSPELHWCFEADLFVRPKGELELYQMLLALMAKEAATRDDVRRSEFEMKETLEFRCTEEEESQLLVTYVQADIDANLRTERLKLKAQKKAEMILRKSDVLKDYLEPFMIKIGLQKITNKKQAFRIRDDCMQSLKDRLVCQANIIKESFAKEVELIDTAHQWYHSHFTSLSSQDIADYRVFLLQHMFTGHILERRLITLKEYAPIKYHALYDTLHKDPRLEPFLI